MLADLKGLHHVWMIERGDDSRFIQEHAHEISSRSEVRQDSLDDHQSMKAERARRARQKDLGHSAGGDASEDFVFTEFLPPLNAAPVGGGGIHWREIALDHIKRKTWKASINQSAIGFVLALSDSGL